jgi:hypothetical protein
MVLSRNFQLKVFTMPTECNHGVGRSEVDSGSTKICISYSKVLVAFGGKSFFWHGDNDGGASVSEDEVSVNSFAVKVVPHVEGGSTITSVSTMTTISGRTTSGRNFPRRAKGKEVLVVPHHAFNILLEGGTIITDNVADDVPDAPKDISTRTKNNNKKKKSSTVSAKLSIPKIATPT